MGQRDRASLDALGLAQFIKTPARFTMRDERVFDRLEPEQHRLAVGEERLLLPQILYIDVVVDASAHPGQHRAGESARAPWACKAWLPGLPPSSIFKARQTAIARSTDTGGSTCERTGVRPDDIMHSHLVRRRAS